MTAAAIWTAAGGVAIILGLGAVIIAAVLHWHGRHHLGLLVIGGTLLSMLGSALVLSGFLFLAIYSGP